MERMILMSELSQVELQNLRHLIGAHDTSYQKLNTYASQCVDPQIKQMFTKAAQDSLNTKQKLLTMYFSSIFLPPNLKMLTIFVLYLMNLEQPL